MTDTDRIIYMIAMASLAVVMAICLPYKPIGELLGGFIIVVGLFSSWALKPNSSTKSTE